MDSIIYDYNNDHNIENFLDSLSTFRFTLPLMQLKKHRNKDDKIINNVIMQLKNIPTVLDKDILYNDRFINIFYNIIWDLISKLGIATQNFYEFVPDIISEINRITTSDYFIYDCHSTDYYNCGRAMAVINNGLSRFLVFNSDRGFMDLNTQTMYLGCSPNTLVKVDDINIISNYYGRMTKRINKEIEMLNKYYTLDIYHDGKTITLFIKIGKNLIKLNIPTDYPLSPPSGTFNDLTISEAETDNWDPRNKLTMVVDKLLYKYNNNLFPKHKEFLCYLLF